jgi:hypothetical protein
MLVCLCGVSAAVAAPSPAANDASACDTGKPPEWTVIAQASGVGDKNVLCNYSVSARERLTKTLMYDDTSGGVIGRLQQLQSQAVRLVQTVMGPVVMIWQTVLPALSSSLRSCLIANAPTQAQPSAPAKGPSQ